MVKRKYFPELSDEELKAMLHRMHVEEELSINAMAKDLGLSRDTLMRWCDAFGIKTRNTSESMKIRHKRMTSEERKHLASRAHEARRGSNRIETISSKIKRASTTADNAIMSKHEKTFAHALIDADIYDFIFSYPYGVYNLDFAFPAQKVAVEVDGGNWHNSPRKRKQDEKKESFLASEGWTLFRWSTSPHRVSELPDVIALLKTALKG